MGGPCEVLDDGPELVQVIDMQGATFEERVPAFPQTEEWRSGEIPGVA